MNDDVDSVLVYDRDGMTVRQSGFDALEREAKRLRDVLADERQFGSDRERSNWREDRRLALLGLPGRTFPPHVHRWRGPIGPSKYVKGAIAESVCDCGAELVLPR